MGQSLTTRHQLATLATNTEPEVIGTPDEEKSLVIHWLKQASDAKTDKERKHAVEQVAQHIVHTDPMFQYQTIQAMAGDEANDIIKAIIKKKVSPEHVDFYYRNITRSLDPDYYTQLLIERSLPKQGILEEQLRLGLGN